MFSCQFCEIFKNTFTEHLQATFSGISFLIFLIVNSMKQHVFYEKDGVLSPNLDECI